MKLGNEDESSIYNKFDNIICVSNYTKDIFVDYLLNIYSLEKKLVLSHFFLIFQLSVLHTKVVVYCVNMALF